MIPQQKLKLKKHLHALHYSVTKVFQYWSLLFCKGLGQEQVGEVIASTNVNLININTQTQNSIGDKYFEMSNHLGNVLASVSDRKLPEPDGQGGVDFYLADVISYSDYYPYGMQMEGRNGSADAYRYGFNGMEKDDKVKGEGNSYTTHFRQYDPRISRWLTTDPELSQFPMRSPYSALSNSPLIMIDPGGDADFYNRYGKWIGTDGKDDGRVLVLKSSKLKREIKRKSKEGLAYKEPVQRGEKVMEMPTGDIMKEVKSSVERTKKTKQENGGHANKGDEEATRWDEGPSARFTYDEFGEIDGAEAYMYPFKVDGTQNVPKDASDLNFWWHTHPDKTLKGTSKTGAEISIDLGDSSPSDADFSFQKKMEDAGFEGNTFVIGVRMDYVSFYNSDKKLLTMRYKKFKEIGTEKRGRVWKKFNENQDESDE